MKSLLSIGLVLITLTVSAQQNIFLDRNGYDVPNKKRASYIKEVEEKANGEFAVIYDLDGNKVQETFSYINENEEPIEVISYFYENGNLKLKTESKFGHLNGLVESYHENGQIMRAEYYELGDLKEGKCFDARGNKIACDSFAQLPEFPGGEQALDAYIAKFENYLLAPVKKENKFVLNFSFDVNPDGTVTYPTIYDNSNKEVEKRLVKIMSMMPKWNPATLEDQPIRKTVCFTMGWELMAKN